MFRSASQSPGYWNSAKAASTQLQPLARSAVAYAGLGSTLWSANYLTKFLLVIDAALQPMNREDGIYFELAGCASAIQT